MKHVGITRMPAQTLEQPNRPRHEGKSRMPAQRPKHQPATPAPRRLNPHGSRRAFPRRHSRILLTDSSLRPGTTSIRAPA
ncbi:hypothetical protein C2L65_29985 [Paraburkholderia terrae]|uniref:Uncharacterized protein n=1 Tax=Paraburkholderia terrae TaxID=311230 RepID=A0A2I8EWJ5_9BURK|nr:hypothetical protein C2L65_29985 [Paraburkholderia terrae]